ncbi:MAG: hypothetical protein FWG90_00910 [Oscillospiraceae bacterium]|nr:hypothetical protein [Oscillospiraceae bacterium]
MAKKTKFNSKAPRINSFGKALAALGLTVLLLLSGCTGQNQEQQAEIESLRAELAELQADGTTISEIEAAIESEISNNEENAFSPSEIETLTPQEVKKGQLSDDGTKWVLQSGGVLDLADVQTYFGGTLVGGSMVFDDEQAVTTVTEVETAASTAASTGAAPVAPVSEVATTAETAAATGAATGSPAPAATAGAAQAGGYTAEQQAVIDYIRNEYRKDVGVAKFLFDRGSLDKGVEATIATLNIDELETLLRLLDENISRTRSFEDMADSVGLDLTHVTYSWRGIGPSIQQMIDEAIAGQTEKRKSAQSRVAALKGERENVN